VKVSCCIILEQLISR